MPTEKRQRQKEGRRARLEARRKQVRRRQLVRRSLIVLVMAGVVVGAVVLTVGSSSPAKLTAQQKVNAIAVKAGCPAKLPTATDPVNSLSWKKPPAYALKANTRYYASVDTTAGEFEVLLNTTGAPINANNFVFLAKKDFYNCVPFQRVIPGFMDQGGDPTGTGSGGPGYVVPVNEFPKPVKSGYQYRLGAVAMANSCPQTVTVPSKCVPSNESQFFVVTGPEGESLPARYTLIGQVVSGMSAVDEINSEGVDTEAGVPTVTQRILSVTVTAIPEKK